MQRKVFKRLLALLELSTQIDHITIWTVVEELEYAGSRHQRYRRARRDLAFMVQEGYLSVKRMKISGQPRNVYSFEWEFHRRPKPKPVQRLLTFDWKHGQVGIAHEVSLEGGR